MPKVNLVKRVGKALAEAGVQPGERLLVAVSGGADSLVLLRALVHLRDRLGLRLHVAHLHHGLRGQAADRDAAFVVSEAARYGLAVSLGRVDPADRGPGESLQVWARRARYRWLETVRAQIRAAWILVAHTQDDQAETVLLNLLRGTGPRGLAGIPPVRDRILRPLLQVSRQDVEAFATSRDVAFRTDRSNASFAYRRNRIRHQLLPLLAKAYNPRIAESLAALADLAREDDAALCTQGRSLVANAARLADSDIYLRAGPLRRAPVAVTRRAFHEAYRIADGRGHSLTRRHVEALRGLLTRGATVRLPGGLAGERSGEEVRIGPARDAAGFAEQRGARPGLRAPFSEGATRSGEVSVRPGVWAWWEPFECRIRVRRLGPGAIGRIRSGRRRQVVSLRLLDEPLRLRGWRPGDRFRPLGGSGGKKLQDFFVDAKVPRWERGRVPLLLSGERIAWVVGYRIAEDFRWPRGEAGCLVEVQFPRIHATSKTHT